MARVMQEKKPLTHRMSIKSVPTPPHSRTQVKQTSTTVYAPQAPERLTRETLDTCLTLGHQGIPFTRFFVVGPEEAGMLLDLSKGNRNESDNSINEYGRAAVRGDWITTHQGCAISNSDVLLDGHHRCLALEKFKARATMPITFGLPDAAKTVIDGGKGRSLQDRLVLSGKKYTKKCIATVRNYYVISRDCGRVDKLSMVEFEEKMQIIAEPIEKFRKYIDHKFTAPFWGAICFGYLRYPEQITTFVEHVVSGVGLAAGSPALTLRDWLSTCLTGGSYHSIAIIQHTLLAMRAHVEGRKLSKFSPRIDKLQFSIDFFHTDKTDANGTPRVAE